MSLIIIASISNLCKHSHDRQVFRWIKKKIKYRILKKRENWLSKTKSVKNE